MIWWYYNQEIVVWWYYNQEIMVWWYREREKDVGDKDPRTIKEYLYTLTTSWNRKAEVDKREVNENS